MSTVLSVRRLALLAVLTVLSATGLVLTTSTAAHADPYPPKTGCALSSSPLSGSSVSLTGSGFPASSAVALSMGSTSVGSVQSDSSGAFQTSLAVPANAGSVITAKSGSTVCTAGGLGTRDQTITRTSSRTDATASTGFQAIAATAVAIALLVGGVALVLIGRRRRSTGEAH